MHTKVDARYRKPVSSLERLIKDRRRMKRACVSTVEPKEKKIIEKDLRKRDIDTSPSYTKA